MVKAWLLGVVAVLAIGVRGVAAVNAVSRFPLSHKVGLVTFD